MRTPLSPLPEPRLAPVPRDRAIASGQWAVWVVVVQIACQLMLLVPEFAAIRAAIRFLGFAVSLTLVAAFWGRGAGKPGALWRLAVAIAVILGLSCLHPDGQVLAGLGTAALNLAILGPIFWMPALRVTARHLRLMLLALLCFNGLSSIVAVLQVYYPGQFQWTITSVYTSRPEYLQELTIRTAAGETIFRPTGLTDIPGGAASSGFFASLLGACLLFTERRALMRGFCILCIFAGLFSLYVSQVRVMIVMTGISYLTFLLLLFWKRCIGQFAVQISVGVVLAVVTFQVVLDVGGFSVTKRMYSLVEQSPVEVYYMNRGQFLEYTITHHLGDFPLGAGPGRWGMMCFYFGEPQHAIWAEIQWTGWLLDGGVPLVAAYAAALVLALVRGFRVIQKLPPGPLLFQAALIVGFSLGAVASTFNGCGFSTTFGLTFWLLNTAIFQAVTVDHRARLRKGQRPRTKPALIPQLPPMPSST